MKEIEDDQDVSFESPELTPEQFAETGRLMTAFKKSSWVKNVVRVQGLSQEEAEALYDKIQPHGRSK